MYFPYLRGKQYELLALRESISFIQKDKIVPIIEPVRSNTASLKTAITALFKAEIQLQIILNPEVGDFKHNNNGLMEFVDGLIPTGVTNIIPTFLISNDNDFLRVRTIIEERGYSNFGYSLIHVNKVNDLDQLKEFTEATNCKFNIVPIPHLFTIRRKLSGNICMLNDYFNRQSKNTEYINIPFEVFSSDYLYYGEEGCIAFSDYQTIGKDYSEGGGAAYAVAIHLTFKEDDKEDIQIAHFVSDSNDGPENPAGKFFEALEKLIEFVGEKGINSLGVQKFREYHENQGYPGLGVVKKLSIMHHVELVQSLI